MKVRKHILKLQRKMKYRLNKRSFSRLFECKNLTHDEIIDKIVQFRKVRDLLRQKERVK